MSTIERQNNKFAAVDSHIMTDPGGAKEDNDINKDEKKTSNDMEENAQRDPTIGDLIMWNIFKTLKQNPSIDLMAALKVMQAKIESNDDSEAWENPEHQYLYCAVLAWQQLGHHRTDSLFEFVQAKQNEVRKIEEARLLNEKKLIESVKFSEAVPGCSKDYTKTSPVVMLPIDTRKVILHLDRGRRSSPPIMKTLNKELMNKIDAACCIETPCLDRLSKLDKVTTELRLRAQRLARREAERIEHLERAETAWRNLEMGYQRRLAVAEEKEENMMKHFKKMIEERNGYKCASIAMAQELRALAEVVENERERLTEMEKCIGLCACQRSSLNEEISRLGGALAQLQCKATQLDRDLQFKQEEMRRALQSAQNDAECARVLSHEVERTMHSELTALRNQITGLSAQLLEKDSENAAMMVENNEVERTMHFELSAIRNQITGLSAKLLEKDSENATMLAELTDMREEKTEITEDVEKCQQMCDSHIQDKIDELNAKRKQLKELKDKVLECRCKLPVHAAVEVKRTPSLVASCKCLPDEKVSDNCSCTSLRTTLLTNFLSDLFGGLQSEMGGYATQMPCSLLKCLEDRHNWEQSSVIKSNIQNHFSRLLTGELDIAIATSIEKYHARWVGSSCADVPKPAKIRCGSDTSGGADRAVERRALELAGKLAEQLFQERADQLTAKAKEVLKAAPSPCKCRPQSAAVYPCFVKTTIPDTENSAGKVTASDYWHRTHRGVTLLRAQLEDMKKTSIKKEDLKMMEENIAKIIQPSVTENYTNSTGLTKCLERKQSNFKNIATQRSVNFQLDKNSMAIQLKNIAKKHDYSYSKKINRHYIVGFQMNKTVKNFKKIGETLAVNVCLPKQKKDTNKSLSTYVLSKKSNCLNEPKPIITDSIEIRKKKKCKIISHPACASGVACFHKSPSNTSIEKLLQSLVQYKRDISKINSDFEKNQIGEENYVKLCKTHSNNDACKYSSRNSNITKTGSALVTKDKICITQQTDMNILNTNEHCIPGYTESIYMGAINLDKSNENYCTCQKKDQTTDQNQCINSRTCLCNVNHTRNSNIIIHNAYNQELNTKNNKSSKSMSMKHVNLQLPAVLEPSQPQTGIAIDSKITNEESEKVFIKNKSHSTETSSPLCFNDEYCIKFLGVTLTNEKRAKTVEVENKNDVFLLKQTFGLPNGSDILKQSDMLSNFKDNKNEDKNDELCATMCDSQSKCCSVVEKTKKELSLDNMQSKQQGDYIHTENKIQNSEKLHSTNQSCVCCKTTKSDGMVDLEENTFNLLEAHLRDRLNNFSSSACEIECLTPQQENTLFSTILERVKQIIKQNTSSLSCKCSKIPENDSWLRAYGLLQEYLRIKINKIHCVCPSSNDKSNTILPDIMEKICCAIDSDFDRLKDTTFPTNQNVKTAFPERDINSLHDCTKPSKDASDKHLKFSQHIYSQVWTADFHSNKLSDVKAQMTKSLNKGNNDNSVDSNYNNDKGVCTSSNAIMTNKCVDAQAGSSVKSLNLNTTKNKHDQMLTSFSEKEQVFPFVGYTIDCTYDENKKTSDCAKSIALKNKEKIYNTWKTLTSQLLRTDLSYIMGAVPQKHNTNNMVGFTVGSTCDRKLESCSCAKSAKMKNKENLNELTNKKLQTNDVSYIMDGVLRKRHIANEASTNYALNYKYMCDTKTSVHGEEDITLKHSTDKIGKTFKNASYDVSKSLTQFSTSCCRQETNNDFVLRKSPNGDVRFDSNLYPLHGSLSSNCECNVVPLCHVKMLVNNIENKLLRLRCTCDSMSSEVCPLHSNKNQIAH